jgi:hypothetical protein
LPCNLPQLLTLFFSLFPFQNKRETEEKWKNRSTAFCFLEEKKRMIFHHLNHMIRQ